MTMGKRLTLDFNLFRAKDPQICQKNVLLYVYCLIKFTELRKSTDEVMKT